MSNDNIIPVLPHPQMKSGGTGTRFLLTVTLLYDHFSTYVHGKQLPNILSIVAILLDHANIVHPEYHVTLLLRRLTYDIIREEESKFNQILIILTGIFYNLGVF